MLDQLFTCKLLLATAYWRSSHKGDLVNVLTKKGVSFSRSPETSLISSAKTSLMESSWWDKETEVTNRPSSKTEVSNNYSGNWHPTPTYVSTPKRYKKKLTTTQNQLLCKSFPVWDLPDRRDPHWECLADSGLGDMDHLWSDTFHRWPTLLLGAVWWVLHQWHFT